MDSNLSIKVFDLIEDGVVVYDANSKEIVYSNNSFEEIIRLSSKELLQKTIDDVHKDSFQNGKGKTNNLTDIVIYEASILNKKVNKLTLFQITQKVLSHNNKLFVVRIYKNITEITELKKKLDEDDNKFNTILDNVGAYVFIKDLNYKYLYANKKVRELFGRPLEDILGDDDSSFFDPEAFRVIRENDSKVIEKGLIANDEELIYDENGNLKLSFWTTKVPLYDANGKIYALCGVSTDTTQQKIQDFKIEKMAFYDTLTDLPNRQLMQEKLIDSLAMCKRKKSYGAFLFIDLDNFKPINDLYGHDIGDFVLKYVADTLKKNVRKTDVAARLGGDEFVVIINELSDDIDESTSDTKHIVENILAELKKPIKLPVSFGDEKIEYICGASIGVVLFDYKKDEREIIKIADDAMYEAKKTGRAKMVFIHI